MLGRIEITKRDVSLLTKKQVEHALEMLESHSYNQVAEKTGISKSTLIRAMKKVREKEKNKEI